MSVPELSKEQLDELRWRLYLCCTDEDYESIGAHMEDLTEEELKQIAGGELASDEILFKCFGGYYFVSDDFVCTMGAA